MHRLSAGFTLLIAAATSACSPVAARSVATPPPISSEPAASEVVAATERLLDALRDRDTTRLRELMDPAVRFFAVRVEGPTPQVRTLDGEEFLRLVSQSPEPFIERIWEPQVHVDGRMASLWTAYDVHAGARFSHCGRAAFQFVPREGSWRLLAETYSVRFTACDGPARSR